jgi:hypothetical protein
MEGVDFRSLPGIVADREDEFGYPVSEQVQQMLKKYCQNTAFVNYAITPFHEQYLPH